MAAIYPYHPSLLALLAENPAKGHGHRWFYKAALHLRHYHDQEQVFAFLRSCADSWGDRVIPDAEIRKAVSKAFSCTGEERDCVLSFDWPMADMDAIHKVVENTRPLPISPDTGATTARTLAALFGPDELVCAGLSNSSGAVGTRDEVIAYHKGPGELQFVVPSPMSTRSAVNQEGKPSFRCLANTGRRRFIIVENDCGTKEEQARILAHLDTATPQIRLSMVVDSGGKSLHGWFDVRHLEEPIVMAWFAYAVHLGADAHTWTRCQWVRMPGGTRRRDLTTAPQPVVWLCHDLMKEIID